MVCGQSCKGHMCVYNETKRGFELHLSISAPQMAPEFVGKWLTEVS